METKLFITLLALSSFGLIIFFIAQKRRHPSRSKIKSFLILLLPIICILSLSLFLFEMLEGFFEINNKIFINGFIGGILMGLILTWRNSLVIISRPAACTNIIDRLKDRFRSLKKLDRQLIFGALVWSAGVLIYTIGLDPFNNGSWENMDGEEYSTLFFVMFVPPLFISVSKKLYDKWVR